MAKKNIVSISVIGENAEDVAGSASLITFEDLLILFEFGLVQKGKNIYENYCYNKEQIAKIKPRKINYIIAGHAHADHVALIPALYAKGCTATIYVPKGTYSILKEMWLDCAYINERDCEILTAQREKYYEPFYINEDVNNALAHVVEIDMHEKYEITETFKLRFIPAGHILFSAQTELFFTKCNNTKKVVFTSDLGNLNLKNNKIFVEDFEPIKNADVVIGEATYASNQRNSTRKTLKKDMEKIKTTIEQYCVDGLGRVLIPCFALDRLPYMIWLIYSLFSGDENFHIPICIDSPLGIRLLKAYERNVPENMKYAFNDMLAWKNFKFIEDSDDSKAAIVDGKPKVILASAGMLTAGRSVKWTKSILPNENDCILFIGYCATNTLAYKIKNFSDKESINISGAMIKNKANIVDLKSFSSHMQHSDLLNYYSSINAQKIYLVHSNQNDKLQFKEELQNEISKQNKTTKIVAVNKSTVINI